ncbi:MAG TPA: DNA polymerase III subunit gamma/tau C-terminal domain-containing protein, partial [Rhodanobacteraceae bacterium]|nr:DNA polymerase III subunit gamma/tau C-terminal domain-containing protein [Rhodanobacteraceae bacterium]
EPPEHVKFLLATTDPQKLLVTVLSRCLKFGLKRLLPGQIAGQMRMILGQEGIAFDDGAITELARGADGSLRDGLSLLDQAIAHGGGTLRADDVRAMLGTISDNDVGTLLRSLADGDGKALLAEADRIAGLSSDFAMVLEQLASALHRIQLRQLVPGFEGDEPEREVLAALAAEVDPEDVQVWYQFALNGRRDLPLAPDARSGFEMTLLRMLAFESTGAGSGQANERSANGARVHAQVASPAATGVPPPREARREHPIPVSGHPAAAEPVAARIADAPARPAASRSAAPRIDSVADWEAWIDLAGLGGPVGQLARHALPRSFERDVLTLVLKPEHMVFCSDALCRQLQDRLGQAVGRNLRVRVVPAETVAETPAARAATARSEQQAAAERAMADDPIIQDFQRELGAEIIPESIRPAGTRA